MGGLTRLVLPVVAAAVLLAQASAVGAAERMTLDPNHGYFGFVVDHFGYSRTVGRFNQWSGEVVFDQDSPEKSTVKVEIKVASVDTNHARRDTHLKGPDFFDVDKHPTMTFVSTKVEKTGERTGKVTGDFTMLGVTRPVTLEIALSKIAPYPLPNYKGLLAAGFSARGQIKRSDFGMGKFVPAIGDVVDLVIEVDAIRCEGEAAEAPSCKSG